MVRQVDVASRWLNQELLKSPDRASVTRHPEYRLVSASDQFQVIIFLDITDLLH
jgi:hypothetical protein